jgi:hypothetical protein
MKRLTILSLILAGSLIACHHPTAATAAAQGQPVKHCGYITQQTAEAVYGGHLNPAREMGMGCTYFADEDGQKGVLVTLIPPMGAAVGTTEMTFYDSMLKSDPTSTAVPVGGLGDRAHFITTKDGSMVSLQVLYHNSVAAIAASNSKNPNLKADLIQAMRQMMQKL